MPNRPPLSGEFFDGKCWFERKAKSVTIGVTNLALEDLGAIESVEFAEQGITVDQGDVIATIHGSESSFEVEAPAAGTLESINDAASADGSLVNDDPLDEGWLVEIQVEDPADLIAASGQAESTADGDEDSEEDEDRDQDDSDDDDSEDDFEDDLDDDLDADFDDEDMDDDGDDDDSDENEF